MLGRLVLTVFGAVRLIDVREGIGEDGEYTECSNMTIINLALRIIGPTHEQQLTIYLLSFQVISTVFIFCTSTWICMVPCHEHTSKVLRYGTRSQGISQFYLHTPRLSANGMNHTCLCLSSRSWYSFTDPGGLEG